KPVAPVPVSTRQRAASADAVRPWSRTREALAFIGLGAMTVVLFSLILPPLPYWPLAFVCLAPWGIAVYRTHHAWIVHWGSFLVGWAFFLINLKWLMPVTGLGYVALAFYLALY